MKKIVAVITLATLTTPITPALGHSHRAANSPHGQLLANGQNHPAFRFIGGGLVESCIEYGLLSGYGDAWFGLETAHHGPDQGTAGRGDECFVTDGVPTTGLGGRPTDDRNPGID